MAISSDETVEILLDLGNRSYPIFIGPDLLDSIGPLMVKHSLEGRAAVISNRTVVDLFGEKVEESLQQSGFRSTFHTVGDGDEFKNLDSTRELYDALLDLRIERGDTIIGLGGGVVGDIAGYVSATLLRGVNFVQVPTTLLAQVDSSVGGKVGVNHESGKNLIGAFYQPRFVLADTATLASLPENQMRSGLAEIIKCGCIGSIELFQLVETAYRELLDLDNGILTAAISSSCRIKAEIVEMDERDLTGQRALLNFGHTIGHAIESLSGYKGYLHGEAVAIGMIAAGYMGTKMTGFPREDFERLVTLIKAAGFQTDIRKFSVEDILDRTYTDKKVAAGKVEYVLPERIGSAVSGREVPDELVHDAIGFIRTLQ